MGISTVCEPLFRSLKYLSTVLTGRSYNHVSLAIDFVLNFERWNFCAEFHNQEDGRGLQFIKFDLFVKEKNSDILMIENLQYFKQRVTWLQGESKVFKWKIKGLSCNLLWNQLRSTTFTLIFELIYNSTHSKPVSRLHLIYQIRKTVVFKFPNTERRVKNTTRNGVFLTNFEVFGKVVKHGLSCLKNVLQI